MFRMLHRRRRVTRVDTESRVSPTKRVLSYRGAGIGAEDEGPDAPRKVLGQLIGMLIAELVILVGLLVWLFG